MGEIWLLNMHQRKLFAGVVAGLDRSLMKALGHEEVPSAAVATNTMGEANVVVRVAGVVRMTGRIGEGRVPVLRLDKEML
jgi:hypothetical protein